MNFQTRLAAKILDLGGVISNPTDTVQGLTCLPYEQSIQRMLWLKHRSPAKGLILLASDVDFFCPYVQEPKLLAKIKNQQQPTTYLLEASNNVSILIKGDFDTVAVRLTDNALIGALCQQTNSVLLSSSANIAGKPIARSILELNRAFKQKLDFIISPKNYNTQPSHIINLQTGEQLR